MKITLVVAVSQNGVIGRDGGLPWRLSTDLKRFKQTTLGKPVVMGRKTWQGLPAKPLPGRHNIVVTRDGSYRAEGADVVSSIADALTLARVRHRCSADTDEICVIGGGQIFAELMNEADVLDVTHVLADIDGDTFFPDIDPELWQVISSEEIPAGEKDNYPSRHVIYERRQGHE